MSRNLLSEFIYHLDADDSMKIEHAPENVQSWLEEAGLPMDILRFLQWDWPQVDSQIGHIAVLSSKNIMEDEQTPKLLAHRFLQLGSAPNGDMFVLDISSEQCRPGFITHEEYWDHEEDPRAVYEPIARSMESLLYRIVEGRYLPTDYYAAKDFNSFLREENKESEQVGAGDADEAV